MADSQDRASFRQSLADALATGDLRRLQLTWTFASIGSWTFFIVLAVYAYDRGGATAVGVAALARMVPAGLAAPLAGMIVDRSSRREVLLASTIGRSVLLAGIAACVAADAPLAVVLVLAALVTALATAHKPAQAALLPTLAGAPRQIAASNAVLTSVENVGFLAGALLGGALVAETEHPDGFRGHRGTVRAFGLAARAHPARPDPGSPRACGRRRAGARGAGLGLPHGRSRAGPAADRGRVGVLDACRGRGRRARRAGRHRAARPRRCGRGLAEQRLGRRGHRGRSRRHLAARARAPRRRARRRLPAGGRRAAGHGRVARGGRGRGNAGGPGRGLQPDRDRGADAAPAPHLRGSDRTCVRRDGEQLLDHNRRRGDHRPDCS